MNIGIFTYNYFAGGTGGAQVCAHCMANEIEESEFHKVTLFTSSHEVRYLRNNGIKTKYSVVGINRIPVALLRRYPSFGKYLHAAHLNYLIRKYDVEVMQVIFSWPWVCAFPWITKKCLKIIRCAGDDIQIDHNLKYGIQRDDLVREIQREGFMHSDLNIAISETVKSEYIRMGIEHSKIQVIYPGVKNSSFTTVENKTDLRNSLRLEIDNKIIIGVGRNHPKKRFKDLLSALSILNKTNNKYKLVIVGKGVSDLLPIAESLGVDKHFIPVEDISIDSKDGIDQLPAAQLVNWYKVSDYFVHPSALETYANVAVEAMAAGLPVIVSDAPGNIDTVRDGADGLIVPLGQPDEIAKKIILCENNLALVEKLKRNGLAKAAKQDWHGITDQYIRSYQKLRENPHT